MKKLIIKLLVFAGSFGFGMFLANVAIANEPERGDKGILWKVEGKGIKTSYVFGTFHLISQSDFQLSDKAKELLAKSDKLVLELDMDDPTLQSTMMQYAGMQGDNSLKNLLSAEDYTLVDKAVTAQVGAGLAAFDKLKPFVISTMLYPTLFDEAIASYELSLTQLAMAGQKEVLGLETVEYQMSIFDKIPYDLQADELVEIITQKDEMAEVFRQMVANYKAEDIEALQRTVDSYYEQPDFSKWLLDDRNKNWVGRIGELSKESSNFYAVGAGHLGGKNGLINLLKVAGYKVTAVEQ